MLECLQFGSVSADCMIECVLCSAFTVRSEQITCIMLLIFRDLSYKPSARMRAARATVVVPCVCVYVYVFMYNYVCMYSVCLSVRTFLSPRASRPRNNNFNRCVYVFTVTRKKTFIIVIFDKNASSRSYSVICLPRCLQLHLNTKGRIPKQGRIQD